MAEQPRVRVVVVNFDGGAVTLRCVDALLASVDAQMIEVVVVDNASIDGLIWTLRERYPQVRVIVSDTNEGFARGCNLAMGDLDDVDFVALVNNDAVVEPGWLAPLLAAIEPADVGAAVPKLLLNLRAWTVHVSAPLDHTLDDGRAVGVGITEVRGAQREVRYDERFWADERAFRNDNGVRWTKQPLASVWWPVEPGATEAVVTVGLRAQERTVVRVGDGRTWQEVTVGAAGADCEVEVHLDRTCEIINSAGGGLYAGWHGGDRGFLEPDIGQFDDPAEVFSWCGGAVLLKAEYLRQVGLFDPTFFLYYEDFDLSWRGRAQGWRYVYEPSSVVHHEHAYSSKEGSSFFTFWVDRNRRLTLVKNAPWPVALRATGGIFSGLARDLVHHVLHQARRRRPPSPRWLRDRARNLKRVLSGLPHAWRERRRIARARTDSRDVAARWMVTK